MKIVKGQVVGMARKSKKAKAKKATKAKTKPKTKRRANKKGYGAVPKGPVGVMLGQTGAAPQPPLPDPTKVEPKQEVF